MPALTVQTPLGPLSVIDRDGVITALRFAAGDEGPSTPVLREAAVQLTDYFQGRRTGFALPLAPDETPFQARMRQAMLAIPFGATRSYGDIARAAGGAPRAVGQACGRNPIPIIVPCHRVVAAHGGLGGYSGGAGPTTKRWLLAHEAQDDLFALNR